MGAGALTRVRGLGRRCTLHFKYDGDATLYVRVFGEDGRRAGCCPEDSGGNDELGLGDDAPVAELLSESVDRAAAGDRRADEGDDQAG